MQHKNLKAPFELKTLDEEKGIFEGYGNYFNNVDLYRDRVLPGAFEKTLAEWGKKNLLPPMLWQHDPRTVPGKWLEMAEDKRGLRVVGQLALKTQLGNEAFELMRMGAINGLSIGYDAKAWEFDKEKRITTLKQIDLWELSIVTFPANDKARIDEIKGLLTIGEVPTVREFEEFLRDAGFSRQQAKQIISAGYKTVDGSQRDAAEVNTKLRRLLTTLGGTEAPPTLENQGDGRDQADSGRDPESVRGVQAD